MAAPLTWGDVFADVAQPVQAPTTDQLINHLFRALEDALDELELENELFYIFAENDQ